MIVIAIDLWKHGDPEQVTRLGTIHITNDGTGTPRRGNYRAKFWGRNKDPRVHHRLAGHVVISDFPRRTQTAFHLLWRVLNSAGFIS